MKAKGTKRTKKMDVLFIIDATGSMQDTIQAAHDKAEDLAFDLKIQNRTADFQFGCVCYRDPVDVPTEKNLYFEFSDEIEDLAEFLGEVEAEGGGDGPEDFVGALQTAFTKLTWRDGKRAIIWIADAPAHGKLYCGIENHQEEEPKLGPLVERLAREGYYFVGISLDGGADRSFSAMREIYDRNGGKSFKIESFSPDKGNEIERIAATMATSTMGVVKAAFTDA